MNLLVHGNDLLACHTFVVLHFLLIYRFDLLVHPNELVLALLFAILIAFDVYLHKLALEQQCTTVENWQHKLSCLLLQDHVFVESRLHHLLRDLLATGLKIFDVFLVLLEPSKSSAYCAA